MTMEKSENLLDELRITNRLLALLATRDLPQPKAVALLDSVGFQPKHIASVLGVTPNAVRIALHRVRKAEQTSMSNSGQKISLTENSEERLITGE